jgi:hypothetical protein
MSNFAPNFTPNFAPNLAPNFTPNFAPNPINNQHGDVANEFKTLILQVPLRSDFGVMILVCFGQ